MNKFESNGFTDVEVANINFVKAKIKDLIWGFVQEMGPVVDSNNFFVSGGCVASLLQNDTPKPRRIQMGI